MAKHKIRFSAGFLLLFFTLAVLAQPRKEEWDEKNDPKNQAKNEKMAPLPKVNELDELGVGSFSQEAIKAPSPTSKNFLLSFAIPHDRIISTVSRLEVTRIALFPTRQLPEEKFEVKVLDGTGTKVTPKEFVTGSGMELLPFEKIVLDEVEAFLKRDKLPISREEQLETAIRAMACARRFHLLAVSEGKRVGREWDALGNDLKNKHIDCMRGLFALYRSGRKYEKADELGLKLLAAFPDDVKVKKDIYQLQLQRVVEDLKAPTDEDYIRLRGATIEYEQIPGTLTDPLLKSAKDRLTKRAENLVAEAIQLNDQGKSAEGLNRLRVAETIAPDLAGIVAARNRLKGAVLYVGVSALPEKMTPATARTDSEKWTVELLFESLVRPVTVEGLTRYRPMLAAELPTVDPLCRTFVLPKNIRWNERDFLNAHDIRETINLTKKNNLPDRTAPRDLYGSECVDLLDVNLNPENLFTLQIHLSRGIPHPLQKMNFKILPGRWLVANRKEIDDEEFARNPWGTGPYRYLGRQTEAGGREVAVFQANPYYQARKPNSPHFQEIRMFVPPLSGLDKEAKNGQLHLLPDISPSLANRFETEAGLSTQFRVSKPTLNKRIHILALNHRRPVLQREKLRQGLSSAIDREKILNEVYREGFKNTHSALVGPFPLKSWATPKAAREVPLFKPGAGGVILESLEPGENLRLNLKFDQSDPRNAQAAMMIKTAIEQASQQKGVTRVEIVLDPLDAPTLRKRIELERDFDLALTHLDYTDDLLSLDHFFTPSAAGRGGRNLTGYLSSVTKIQESDRRFMQLLAEVKQHRDFSGELREKTWDIHTAFNQRVPFIPLWQLDRWLAIHHDLQIFLNDPNIPSHPNDLDPAILFQGIEYWKMK